MKYVININQKAIVDLGLQDKLDFIDLAIYDFITEFMLCDECRKLNIDNVQYFWIKSDLIIENLPLLGITTARGISKRIDKLIDCDLLERCNDNQKLHQSFFKVGKNYQAYKFFTWNKNSKGAWNENSNNNKRNTKQVVNKLDYKEEENTNVFPKKNDYQAVFDCWNQYNGKKIRKVTQFTDARKKAIKKMLDIHNISQEVLMRFFASLPFADQWLFHPTGTHKLWKPTFDWWMANTNGWLTKGLEGGVHLENPQAFERIMNSDSFSSTSALYFPQGRDIWFNEETKSYWSTYNFYDERIYDGYTDEERPDGAEITLNNGRGTYRWNSNNKKWEKK